MRALTVRCRMNEGLWSYTPQNPLFSGYNFLSSHLNVEFERGGKKNTHCWVFDFFKSLFGSPCQYTCYEEFWPAIVVANVVNALTFWFRFGHHQAGSLVVVPSMEYGERTGTILRLTSMGSGKGHGNLARETVM